MKTNQNRKQRGAGSHILAGTIIGLTVAWQPVAAEYDTALVGPPASASSKPVAINNESTVVGSYTTQGGAERAFVWMPFGGVHDLGTLGGASARPLDINDRGEVIGYSDTSRGQRHLFLWTTSQGMTDLGPASGIRGIGRAISATIHSEPPPDDGGNRTQAASFALIHTLRRLGDTGRKPITAVDMNGAGTVVGASHTEHGNLQAFRCTPEAGMQDLATNFPGSFATQVNASGQVIGRFLSPESVFRAFLWTETDDLIDLGIHEGGSSCPTALSDSGRVVGWANAAGGVTRAFLHTAEGGIQDLGQLGGSNSCAHALNEQGTVVGWAEVNGGRRHAFSWTADGGMIDLGTPGGVQSAAVSLNESGTVLGYSTTADGVTQACIWAPKIPGPTEILAQRH